VNCSRPPFSEQRTANGEQRSAVSLPIRLGVVLVAVDRVTGVVLLGIDLRFFLTSQFSAVGRAICAHLLVDVLFATLEM
jgi:hypothetical protein